MSRFVLAQASTFDINGSPRVAATLDFHNVGLLTDKDTYPTEADAAARTNANPNPVVANPSGNFGNIWLVGDYDATLKNSGGTTIWGPELVQSNITTSSSTTINELTTATMTANTNKAYEVVDVVETAEFSDGNGGGGTYDVVLTSSVTPNTFNIIVGVVDNSISFVLRVGDIAFASQLGMFDGVTDEATAWPIFLALAKECRGVAGGTSITSAEISIPADTNLDLLGGTIKADPTLPNTDNIVNMVALNATIQNGAVDGNKANLIATFTAGSTGCGIFVSNGGDRSRVLNMETFNCPTNGQVAISVTGGTVKDVVFDGYHSHDNDFTGIGGEAQVTGLPLENIQFLNGETNNNKLGGDIRIQGINNYKIINHNGHNGDHGGAVIGPGEANNICIGDIIDSTISNDNVGLPTFSIDAKVGGAGPQAGKINVVEVNLQNVNLVGNGGSNGLLVQNSAIAMGDYVLSENHDNNLRSLTNSIISINNFRSKDSIADGVVLLAEVELPNLVVEGWGSTSDAISFQADSDNSTLKNVRLGYPIEFSGTHDGANNASVLNDSTASFAIDQFIISPYFARNITDGSRATITDNTATTITGVLSGGTDDDWDTGDSYDITKENGDKGIAVVGTPSGITLEIDSFTGFGLRVGGVSGSVLNTWKLKDLGASNMVDFIDGILPPAVGTGRSKQYVNVAGVLTEILHSDGKIETMSTIVTTTAALEDVSNAINTSGRKFEGQMVWNTTTNIPFWANTNTAVGVWIDATGSIIHTPV